MEKKDMAVLQGMNKKIREIEKMIYELKKMGNGIPVIEQNARCMLSFTHTLSFGISDICDLDGDREGPHGRD
ncbi:hypothetical protein ACFL2O_03530 [Thermodesulfobacteriota bacterium]